MTLTREWFEAGFQQNAGIVDGRWQLKAREHGYITEWANPNSDFWNERSSRHVRTDHQPRPRRPDGAEPGAPCCVTQPQVGRADHGGLNNLKAKYSALKRIDLMTVIRGPGNMLCPTPPATDETIVVPPELDAALAAAATKFPEPVLRLAPKFEAPNCAAFSGGGPHLTTAGNMAVAKSISAAFVNLQ